MAGEKPEGPVNTNIDTGIRHDATGGDIFNQMRNGVNGPKSLHNAASAAGQVSDNHDEVIDLLKKYQSAIASGVRGDGGDAAHQAAKPFLDRVTQRQSDMSTYKIMTDQQGEGFSTYAGQLEEMPQQPPGFWDKAGGTIQFWKDSDPWNDGDSWNKANSLNKLTFQSYGSQSQSLAGAMPGQGQPPVDTFANLEIYNPNRTPGGGHNGGVDPGTGGPGGGQHGGQGYSTNPTPGAPPHPGGHDPSGHSPSLPGGPGGGPNGPSGPGSIPPDVPPIGGGDPRAPLPGQTDTSSGGDSGLGNSWNSSLPGYSSNSRSGGGSDLGGLGALGGAGMGAGMGGGMGDDSTRGGSGGGFGRGGMSGAGPRSGAASGGALGEEGAAGGRGAGAGAGRGGAGGAPMGGRGGNKKEDEEHETPSYLITEEHGDEIVGDLPPTAPPVIGG